MAGLPFFENLITYKSKPFSEPNFLEALSIASISA